jgi:asparagine synthetase B (glutamine-hydrolysing)
MDRKSKSLSCARIPREGTMSKLRMGKPKYALKKLAERLDVPVRAIHRPKQRFAMPIARWFRKDLKREIGHILLEPRSLTDSYFNPFGVRTLLEEHWQGPRDNSGSLWILRMFKLWRRHYLDTVFGGMSIASNASSPATVSTDPTGTVTAPSLRATQRCGNIS